VSDVSSTANLQGYFVANPFGGCWSFWAHISHKIPIYVTNIQRILPKCNVSLPYPVHSMHPLLLHSEHAIHGLSSNKYCPVTESRMVLSYL